MIADAVSRWTPEVARINHAYALRRLDWRHRLAVVCETFGEQRPRLAHELSLLNAAMNLHPTDAVTR